MSRGKGEPDRAAATEQVLGVRRGRLVPEHRAAWSAGPASPAVPSDQVEGDHVAVGEAQGLLGVHGAIQPHRLAGCRWVVGGMSLGEVAASRRLAGKTPAGANHAAVSKTATKSRPTQPRTRSAGRDPQQCPSGAAERKVALRLHHRALRRVLALPEGRRALHRRPPRRGRLPDRRGAGPPRRHLFLHRRALLPGARLRGLSRASAGGDRGVPAPRRRGKTATARSSTSTTPSSRPRWPRTTRTSRRPRAASPASRSRRACARSPAHTAW